jgi:endoglucanase
MTREIHIGWTLCCLVLVTACGDDDGASSDAALRDASVTDAAPNDASPVDLGHPFGSPASYASGVIFPSGRTRPELDLATADAYDAWKTAYLEPACEDGQWRIRTQPATSAYTVSEGHGYAMMITVVLAGHDPDARRIYDGLYAYFAAHPSSVNADLMAWAQDESCADVEGDDSATDGDLDVAFSLLLAARQWGSDGPIDYQNEARRVIAAILASDIHPQNSILVGDWASDSESEQYTGTRSSDFMVDHFRAFRAATDVARWDAVVDKTHATVAYLQTQHAPDTGLLPDFAVDAPGATPSPAPAGWLEGDDDGRYAWNACRTPWRLGTDYLVSSDTRARDAVRRMTAFFRQVTGDDPAAVVDGYALDGVEVGSDPSLAFVAPLAVAAMVEPDSGTNAAWLDALWDRLVSGESEDYYGDTLRLLAMIVVSGNWWTP